MLIMILYQLLYVLLIILSTSAKAPSCEGKITKQCTKKGGSCVLAPFEDNCKAGKLIQHGKDCQCCVPGKIVHYTSNTTLCFKHIPQIAAIKRYEIIDYECTYKYLVIL